MSNQELTHTYVTINDYTHEYTYDYKSPDPTTPSIYLLKIIAFKSAGL
jgi:hypothetical protein